jgi:hypothetical protein
MVAYIFKSYCDHASYFNAPPNQRPEKGVLFERHVGVCYIFLLTEKVYYCIHIFG